MPGIQVYISSNRIDSKGIIDSALALVHEPWMGHSVIESGPNYIYQSISYAGYPIVVVALPEGMIVIEGVGYTIDLETLTDQLQNCLRIPFSSEERKQSIRKLINTLDGDYIIHFIERNPLRVTVFNDRWGRLPFFISHNSQTCIMSREVSFVRKQLDRPTFNFDTFSDLCLFQYSLGNNTLTKEIQRLPPATIVEVDIDSNNIHYVATSLATTSFTTVESSTSREEHIENLKSLFLESLSQRVNAVKSHNVSALVDVSGGFDSRTVFAGLTKYDLPLLPITKQLVTGDESTIAHALGKIFSSPVDSIHSSHAYTGNEIDRHLLITDAWVNAHTTTCNYLDSLVVKSKYSFPAFEFMGFGGEFWRHPYRAKPYHRSVLDFALEFTRLNTVTLAPIIKDSEWLNSTTERLRQHFSTYQETSLDDKIKHLYHEYYRNLVGLGEDRHRIFYWTVQPLQSSSLYSYVNTMIPRHMMDTRFYLDFMKAIDPRTSGVPIYGSSLDITTGIPPKKEALKQWAQQRILHSRTMYSTLRGIQINLKQYPHPPLILDGKEISHHLQLMMQSSVYLSDIFKSNVVEKMKRMPPTLRWQLYTLCRYITLSES